MEVSAVVAQFPVSLDMERNLRVIQAILESCAPDDVVVLPEGSLSGYSDDIRFLKGVSMRGVDKGLDSLHSYARDRGIHLFVGTIMLDAGRWYNTAVYLSPRGERWVYRKVNLATHERGYLTAGDELPVMTLEMEGGPLRVGVQLCREIRFPEQWKALAQNGADLILYMTHAIEDAPHRPVWRSHLMSRAAELQRFVLAANTAHAEQLCPTMMIDPAGMVLDEVTSSSQAVLRQKIETTKISNWYLSQARTDLLSATYP